jgi:arylsulfatase A-like enzyme/tetratricopeptide (TPR) repeat protein
MLLALLLACSPQRYNVLVITLDTTRADAIGAYGGAAPTPNIDRLAAEGVRFDRAYSVTPLTIPAHSSIFTGQYPPRHGVRDNGDFVLGDDAVTLAERMKAQGYRTMASVGAEVTSRHWGFAQGFDAFFDDMGARDPQGNRWRVERRGDAVLADAQGWLASNAGQPGEWFAWVHLFDAHHPYEPVDPYASQVKQPYLAEVAAVDGYVGQLVEQLRASGELDSTWIVVMADHGESLGEHGEGFHGVLLYDATMRIPLIVRPPKAYGGNPGRVVGAPVSAVDLVPTLVRAADPQRGVRIAEPLDGVDLFDVLTGDVQPDATRGVFGESLYAFRHYGWAPQRALYTDAHSLIDSTTPELYARTDVRQQDDLADAETDRVEELVARTEALVAGMTPSGAAERAALDPERQSQLEALGYLSGVVNEGAPTEGLPDPVQRLPVLRRVEGARALLRSGDTAGARALLETIVADEPGLGEPRMMLSQVLARTGQVDAAAAIVEALESERPSAQTRAVLGHLRLQQRRPADAVALLDSALAQDPYLASAWGPYLQALFQTQDARIAEAIARGREAVPDAYAPLAFDGILRASRGELEAAVPLLERAMAQDPLFPMLHHALGTARAAANRADEAETLLLEEIRLFPPAIPSRHALAAVFASQKRYEEQLAQLDAILAVEPAGGRALHARAQALFNLKRYGEAEQAVRTCEQAAPDNAECVMLAANVYDKLGRAVEARAAYERALAMSGRKGKRAEAP